MLTYFQAIILGLLQGATELFPISSLGHSVIAPGIFHWQVDQNDPFFLSFLVATHLATALVLVAFFYKDWMLIIFCWFKSVMSSLKRGENDDVDASRTQGESSILKTYARLGWLIILATIPAGLLGLLLQKKLQLLFAATQLVAIALIFNGLMLLAMEWYKKRKVSPENIGVVGSDSRIARLSWLKTLGIGLAQSLALIPGFSRTGSALSGGLLAGLNHEDAARFSFLLATPIILAAAVLKLPHLLVTGSFSALGPLLLGAISAAVAAYFSVRFLTAYFKTKKLTPFGVYCIIAGIAAFILL